jgi:hypothetical protein
MRPRMDCARTALSPRLTDCVGVTLDCAALEERAHAGNDLPVVCAENLVHQDRHRTQLGFGAVDHRLDCGDLRDVRRHRDRRPPAAAISAISASAAWSCSIVHAYGGAALRQEPRRCSAEAAGAARHHRHLGAPFHHVPPSKADQHTGRLLHKGRFSRRSV